MKKILFNGFYGFKNIGDDVFMEIVSWAAYKNNFKNKSYFLSHISPLLQSPSHHLYPYIFKGQKRIEGIIHMLNADYFISAGGSTFTGHKKSSFKEIAEIVKRNTNPKLKTGAIGVSIGPFSSIKNERKVQEYLKKINFLAVRDKRSFEYVCSLNLPYQPVQAFDLAALQKDVYQDTGLEIDKKINTKKIIGISVCPVESVNLNDLTKEKERNRNVIELIKRLNNTFDNVVFRFFIMNGNSLIGDENITRETIAKSGVQNYEIIPYYGSVYKSWKMINQCDFMIATRLHAAIIAAFADVPFILNEYHQKCTDFLDDWSQNTKFRVGDAKYDYDKIVNNIYLSLYSDSLISKNNKENLKKLAYNNFSFFHTY